MRAVALVILALVLTLGTAVAQEYQAGKQYQLVKPPQPTTTGDDSIEVIEFFSYACPHCFHFRPLLHNWLQQTGENVELVRIPVTFGRESWALLAKAFYAAKALGVLGQIDKALFEAIHLHGRRFHDEQALADFFAEHGVERQAALNALNSFSVYVNLQRARRIVRAYEVRATPSMAVAGKYLVAPSAAGGYEAMLDVVDFLIAKERSSHKG